MLIFFFLAFTFLSIVYIGIHARAIIVSPVFVYPVFSALYTLFPLYYVEIGSNIVKIDLPLLTVDLVSLSCLHVLFLNIIVIVLLLRQKEFFRVFVIREFERKLCLSDAPVLFFIIFSPITLALVYLYPWPKFNEAITFQHTIATFSKTLLLLLFCACAVLCKNKKFNIGYLTLFFTFVLIINVVDTARTHMFIAIFAYFLGGSWKFSTVIKRFPVIAVIFTVFLYLTLNRTSIDFTFSLMLWPFFSESIFGSYGALQVLSLQSSQLDFYGSSVFFFSDLFFQLVPSGVSHIFSFFEFNYLQSKIDDAVSLGALDGKLYPLGGHFFLSEFVFYFGYCAAPVFTLIMFAYLKCIERAPGELNTFFLASFFLLVKAPLIVILKICLLALFSFLFFSLLVKVFPKKRVN